MISLIKSHLKNLANAYHYTKSFWLCIYILILWIKWFLAKIFWWAFKKRYIKYRNKSREYIFDTPFWKYLCWNMITYAAMDKNYEIEIQKTLKNILKNQNWDWVFINIWSNIWRWTVDITKKYKCNCISIEPNPTTFQNLKINTVLSNIDDKVELYNIWLGNTNWNMKFDTWQDCSPVAHFVENNDSFSVEKDIWIPWKIIDVPIKRFDDLWIADEKLKKTRLIIMDVEWFEYQVLQWMKRSLENFHDINIIMEIRENQKNKEKIIQLMKDLKYSVKKIDKEDYLFSK